MLLSHTDFAASMGMRSADYMASKLKEKFLSVDAVYELGEKMNFHFSDLLTSDFVLNYDPNDKRPLGNRYNSATFSHTRALINILNYVELTKGTRAKINLLRKFQLSEEFIKQENNKANYLLITDVTKYLTTQLGFTQKDFLAIGRRMPFLSHSAVLKSKLSEHKAATEILECFIYECTTLFDTNCTYRISHMNSDEAVVEVVPNKHVVDALRLNMIDFGNEEVCLTKMGNISSTMYFRYGRNARVKKISSIHQGSESNKYLFDLSPFKKVDAIPDAASSAGIFYHNIRMPHGDDLIH